MMSNETTSLLTHLHRGGAWAYWWTFPARKSHWWQVGEPLPPVPANEANVYFGVHPALQRKGEGERSKTGDVAALNCLFAEFDAKDFDDGDKTAALAHIEALEIPPSVIVDSGGGYHCYWLLREPFKLTTETKRERAKSIQRRWVALVHGDPGAKDLARVLRVPGTRNLKPAYAPDYPTVTMLRADFALQYELDDLEALIPPFQEVQPSLPTTTISEDNGRDPYAEAALASELSKLTLAPVGNRNNQLNTSAFSLGQFVAAHRLDRSEVERLLVSTALHIGLDRDPLCGPEGIRRTIQSGLEGGMRHPRRASLELEDRTWAEGAIAEARKGSPEPSQHLTDLGNARRLVAQHGMNLCYCPTWGRWLEWDGKRWANDDTGAIFRFAKDTVAGIYQEAARFNDDERRRLIGKHAVKSESAQRLRAMVSLAESDLQVVTRPTDFDHSPWLLNVANGTLDLRTGDLLPHRREVMITKLAPVEYDPDARCPLWDAFLERILAGHAALIRFLQRATGYTLTGNTSEQCLFILYGTGANGKSTFLQTISAVLDDYAMQTPVETLLMKRNATIPNDVARLRGAHLVTAAEAEEGQRLAESLIKQMTGNDKLPARFLHAEWFEFTPSFKIFLATNHKPVIRGTDHAIWRRIRLVPFTVTIPEAEQDKELGVKLLDELPGILAWAVRGCLAWQREGLEMPPEVRLATEAYRSEMDRVSNFLDDCCVLDARRRARAGALYEAYRGWCDANEERSMSGTRFGRRLTAGGFDKIKDGHIYYLGIGLLSNEEV